MEPESIVSLSLEPVPEKQVDYYTNENVEVYDRYCTHDLSFLHNRELNPADKFIELVHQIDFETDKDTPTANDANPKQAAIEKLITHLRSAQQEVSQMYDVVAMLEAGRHLQVYPSVRTPISAKSELDNLLYEVISKQQQLLDASNKLDQAAARLNKNVEDNLSYVEGILKLKRHWKLGSDLPPSFYNKPLFSVDYSYKNDGSRNKVTPAVIVKKEVEVDIQEDLEDDMEGEDEKELEKNTLKQMEIQITTASLNKSLRIGDDRVFIDIESVSPALQLSDPLFHRASGVENCHHLLFNAQESVYLKEIFDNISKVATMDKKSQIQQNENEIILETMSENMFKVQMKSRNILENEIDNRLTNPRSGVATIYQLIGYQLFESNKRKYSKQQIEDHKLKYTKHFFKPAPDFGALILEETLALYRHLQLFNQVRCKLDEFCKNIPFLAVCLINTNEKLIQGFEVNHDHNLSIFSIMVHKDQISSHGLMKSYATSADMAAALLIFVVQSIINTIFTVANYFFPRENITRNPESIFMRSKFHILEFKFNIFQSSYDIEIKKINEELKTVESLNWWTVKGNSHEQKAFRLLFDLSAQEF